MFFFPQQCIFLRKESSPIHVVQIQYLCGFLSSHNLLSDIRQHQPKFTKAVFWQKGYAMSDNSRLHTYVNLMKIDDSQTLLTSSLKHCSLTSFFNTCSPIPGADIRESHTLKSGIQDSLTSGEALIQVHTLLNIRECKHRAPNNFFFNWVFSVPLLQQLFASILNIAQNRVLA